MREAFLYCVVLAVVASGAWASTDEAEGADRSERLLSTFQVIRFPNDNCMGTNSRNGTCYTAEECSNKGGTSSGVCAEGFGVCCTFAVKCGDTSSENITYFETQTLSAGMCKVTICPSSDNICRLRLDLNTFVITGPSTISVSQFKTLGGIVSKAGTKTANINTQCVTDTFTVSGNPSTSLPVICGTMSGEHLYTDALPGCNDIAFNLGATATSPTALATRSWSITVSQIECTSNNLPPDGCHQYFYGNTKVNIQTFNFQGAHHLANQNQNICIRREAGFCQICYATAADTDFVLSGKGDAMKGYTVTSVCCGYGTDGAKTSGYDCVMIPGATKKADGLPKPSQICGRSKGIVTASGTTSASVCSKSQPFMVKFMSDNFEFINAIAANSETVILNKGFKLAAEQIAC